MIVSTPTGPNATSVTATLADGRTDRFDTASPPSSSVPALTGFDEFRVIFSDDRGSVGRAKAGARRTDVQGGVAITCCPEEV